MKIVHIITRLVVGGAQENTLATCQALHASGHHVTLIAGPQAGPEGSMLERARAAGYRVLLINSLRRNPHPYHDPRAVLALTAALRRLAPDVVHTHSSKAGILGRWAAHRARVPVILHTIHGLPFHPYQPRPLNALYIQLERWAARVTTRLICVADDMARQARDAAVAPADKFVTIHSGMPVDDFLRCSAQPADVRRRYHLPRDAVIFMTIARLHPLKGYRLLLDAIEDVVPRKPHVHFAWVGDGQMADEIEQRLLHTRRRRHVTLLGRVDPSEIPDLLRAADVLVHPSLHEGLAKVLVQAILSRRPPIAFDLDGAREVVQHEVNGLLVPPASVTDLRAAIVRLADDPDSRRQLASHDPAPLARRFDLRTMTDRIEALYRELIDRPH